MKDYEFQPDKEVIHQRTEHIRPYQVAAITGLLLSEVGWGGILADDMVLVKPYRLYHLSVPEGKQGQMKGLVVSTT
jgi:hypothetical protein